MRNARRTGVEVEPLVERGDLRRAAGLLARGSAADGEAAAARARPRLEHLHLVAQLLELEAAASPLSPAPSTTTRVPRGARPAGAKGGGTEWPPSSSAPIAASTATTPPTWPTRSRNSRRVIAGIPLAGISTPPPT